ncbi:alpha-2,8-sialyltransferase 8B-like [Lytechinus variegatus]|uniref:alpha-2,8-sialyltransferase 8B-like n=1 Tax=Lytechinus variegatus TaxID=7654 RepID=UPI001BB11F6D|nr:alpha-2,8-sialyltransferase 8B-like [Lytechinus variegatus]
MAAPKASRFLPVLFCLLALCMWLFLSVAEYVLSEFHQKPSLVPPRKITLKDPIKEIRSMEAISDPLKENQALKLLPPNFYIRTKVSKKLKKWQAIQIYKRNVKPENFDFKVNETLLLRDNKTESIPALQTCAVVGNSGILSGSSCGKAIDDHDFVFRMNLAPFGRDYGKDVGYKANTTTLNFSQLMSMARCAKGRFKKMSSSCSKMLTNMKLYNNSVIWYSKGSSRKGNMNVLARAMKDEFNFTAGWAYSPVSLFGAVPRIWGKRLPSTGLLILSAASLFCERITMFGFYPFSVDAQNRTLSYHYYDSAKMDYAKNPHKMPVEFKLYMELQKKSAVKLQLGNCN